MIIIGQAFGDYLTGSYSDEIKAFFVWIILGNALFLFAYLVLDFYLIIAMQAYYY